MRTKTMSRKSVVLSVTVLLAAMMLTPTVSAAIVCGQPVEFIQNEPGPVDISCATGDVYVMNGTANLVDGGEVTSLIAFPGSTVNVYGGIIAGGAYGLTSNPGAFVTVYASTAAVENASSNLLVITGDYIQNTHTTDVSFDLIGTFQDQAQTPFVIPCILSANAVISLNIPQALPEIEVLPALLEWDMGDVEVGESATMMVQIYNFGNEILNVSDVSLIGDPAFTFTSGPATPLDIAPSNTIGVDYEVTFTPTAEGPFTAVVQITSDDSDEEVVEVALTGVGVITEIPPTQQIQDILDKFDDSVALETMQGYGPGNSAEKRLNALRNMIESASDLINAGDYAQAIEQLEAISKKTDGEAKPQDFVVGEAVAELNAMVEALIVELSI